MCLVFLKKFELGINPSVLIVQPGKIKSQPLAVFLDVVMSLQKYKVNEFKVVWEPTFVSRSWVCSLFLQSPANRQELDQGNAESGGTSWDGKCARQTDFSKSLCYLNFKVTKVNLFSRKDLKDKHCTFIFLSLSTAGTSCACWGLSGLFIEYIS